MFNLNVTIHIILLFVQQFTCLRSKLKHQDLLIMVVVRVGNTHLVQPIDLPGISGKNLITNKVAAVFPDTQINQ